MGSSFKPNPMGLPMISIHLRFHKIDARSQQESVGLWVNRIYGASSAWPSSENAALPLWSATISCRNWYNQFYDPCLKMWTIHIEREPSKMAWPKRLCLVLMGTISYPHVYFTRKISSPHVGALPRRMGIWICSQALLLFMKTMTWKRITPWTSWNYYRICGQTALVLSTSKTLWIVPNLCAMGLTVRFNLKNTIAWWSIFQHHSKKIRLSMGVSNLIEIFDEKYYRNLSVILEALESCFSKIIGVPHPMIDPDMEKWSTVRMCGFFASKELYKFFKYNEKSLISPTTTKNISTYSKEVLELINKGKEGWKRCSRKSISTHQRENYLAINHKSKRLLALKSEKRVLGFYLVNHDANHTLFIQIKVVRKIFVLTSLNFWVPKHQNHWSYLVHICQRG